MLDAHVVSFVLSQFFGLYLLIVAIIMFNRSVQYRQLVQKMTADSGTILLGGLIGMMLGMFFVGIHNVWLFEPVIFVTLISWLILIVSVLLLTTPERMVIWIRRLCSGSGYYVTASSMAIMGLLLLARGVYLYATHSQSFFFLPH